MIFWVLVALFSAAVAVYLVSPLMRDGAQRAALAAGVLTPACALAFYFAVGAPGLAQLGAPQDEADVETAAVLERLEATVEAAPDQPRAWRELANARLDVQDYGGAVEALRRLIVLDPDDPTHFSALGEALTVAQGGVVAAEAREAFETALAGEPRDVRARFYLAEADYQAGRRGDAITAWGELAQSAPPGAPWLVIVGRRLSRAAQAEQVSLDALGLPSETVDAIEAAIEGRPPPGRRGPSQADVAAAAEMDDDARAAMIEGMVASLAARLEENPDDLEGWLMLARSYRTLDRFEESAQALKRVAELQPDDYQSVRDYAYTLWVARMQAGAPDAETVAAAEDLAAMDPDDPVARLIFGLAAAGDGDTEQARTILSQLADDPEAPAEMRTQARIELEALD